MCKSSQRKIEKKKKISGLSTDSSDSCSDSERPKRRRETKPWSSGGVTGPFIGPVSGQHNGWALALVLPSGWRHTAFLWNRAELDGTRWGQNTRQLNQNLVLESDTTRIFGSHTIRLKENPTTVLTVDAWIWSRCHPRILIRVTNRPRTCRTLAPLVRMGVNMAEKLYLQCTGEVKRPTVCLLGLGVYCCTRVNSAKF